MSVEIKNQIKKIFGGLTKKYYIRQFLFGCIFLGFVIFGTMRHGIDLFFFIGLISTFLYPYSRFVYESIIKFIIGENVFFMNAIAMLIFKFFMMFICWSAAILIAPIGMAYLYIQQSKTPLPPNE